MTCAVCLEEDVTDPRTLLCGHVFHTGCIAMWFEKATTCPTCRQVQADVPLKEEPKRLTSLDGIEFWTRQWANISRTVTSSL